MSYAKQKRPSCDSPESCNTNVLFSPRVFPGGQMPTKTVYCRMQKKPLVRQWRGLAAAGNAWGQWNQFWWSFATDADRHWLLHWLLGFGVVTWANVFLQQESAETEEFPCRRKMTTEAWKCFVSILCDEIEVKWKLYSSYCSHCYPQAAIAYQDKHLV